MEGAFFFSLFPVDHNDRVRYVHVGRETKIPSFQQSIL
jgi:hypothetical protein